MKLNLLLLSAVALVKAATAIDTVNLGTAGNYAILAKTGISTVPASSITGDIAVSPIAATAITGFALDHADGTHSTDTSNQVDGTHKVYAANYDSPTPQTLTTAVSDMETAYTDAAGRPHVDDAKMNLKGGLVGGETLTAGVYTFQVDINIVADIFLKGSSTDIFIIRTTGNLLQAANTNVILQDGADAKNIFWQVAEKVVMEAGAHMEGILLVKTQVFLKTGSSLNGRVLSQTACDLQMATIVEV